MAVNPFHSYKGALELIYAILLQVNPMAAPLGTTGLQSEMEVLYQILLALGGGGGGGGGTLKFGTVTADGTTVTNIAVLAGRTIETNAWIFFAGTKRDYTREMASFSVLGVLTWNAGYEPPLNERIDFFYY